MGELFTADATSFPEGDPPDYMFVGTNFHNSETRHHTTRFDAEHDSTHFPANVTLGFRNNFWRVFSSVTEYDKDDFDFEWLGRWWRFVSFWVIESDKVDFASYLDDKINVFIVFVLQPLSPDDSMSVRELHFRAGLDEQQAVASLIECFRDKPFYIFLKLFRHSRGLNALFTWSTQRARTTLPNMIALFAFYSFCLLMTWKISRDLTKVDLSFKKSEFREHLRGVLRIREQIINVERYFSTKNISNDPETTAVARDIKSRFSLAAKQERFLPLIEAMERHLMTAAQIHAEASSRWLNNMIFLIAFIGLPLSLMGVLLALNDENSVLKIGYSVLVATPQLAFFIFSFAFCVTLVLLFMALHALWEKLRS